MKLKQFIIILILLILGGCASLDFFTVETKFNNLKGKDGLYYKNRKLYTGEARSYYKNKNKKALGTFKDGKFYGIFLFYYENGNLKSKMNFVENKLDGTKYQYYSNGNKKIVKNYIQGKLNGMLMEYYENSAIKFEVRFKDDSMIGDAISYGKEGNITSRITYELDE
ncbi:MAG: hypothetical protein B6227_00600 [Fusobacteriia bacterium 4572_74]|nr:MAG: hypothetical protein B6227_00600 [Fusobacteriia bacterium 4572_74]